MPFDPAAHLAKFGWAQGKGLGRREDGLAQHIRVSKKEDSFGVGTTTETINKTYDDLFSKAATNFAVQVHDSDSEDSAPSLSTASAPKRRRSSDTDSSDSDGPAAQSRKRKADSEIIPGLNISEASLIDAFGDRGHMVCHGDVTSPLTPS